MEKIRNLYTKTFGAEPLSVVRLTGDGSNRAYYRVSGVVPVMAAVGTSVEENRAFVALSKAFSASIEIIIWFLSFNLLIWCITLIDLHILKNPCIPGINPT